jgi:hypothetical protein
VNQGCLLTPVEDGLDEWPTAVGFVEHCDDDLSIGHDDLQGAHVTAPERNCGPRFRACFAFLLG